MSLLKKRSGLEGSGALPEIDTLKGTLSANLSDALCMGRSAERMTRSRPQGVLVEEPAGNVLPVPSLGEPGEVTPALSVWWDALRLWLQCSISCFQLWFHNSCHHFWSPKPVWGIQGIPVPHNTLVSFSQATSLPGQTWQESLGMNTQERIRLCPNGIPRVGDA